MRRIPLLTVFGWTGLLGIGVLLLARHEWVSGFDDNGDAAAVRFYSALALGLLALIPGACLLYAMKRS
ncbi:hypothetical protein [Roseiconus lacunae]|uniref:Uncharacterized protein n=1 Tax=Roseiconus lacunae TaxID=2605694 RepID=A0ABT7PSH8_9BACT|nr:hypothetical protein [Roseiconus lacunae]MCD0458829.1 hypothetical protein [Roseiconus lacunae]MDM4019443.1 hypothetical protein [Roseiconus lacunae]